jgi:NADH dehydrogenase
MGHDDWEAVAPGLKTIEDALNIRRRVLLAFEAAERETDPEEIARWLTFVVVGAGPTGVELAGALGEIAHHTLRHNFRHIDPAQARIVLVEGTGRVLPTYVPRLSQNAAEALAGLGVTAYVNSFVTDVQSDSVTLKRGEGVEVIPTRTVLWAAGVQGSPLGRALADATGVQLDRAGRVLVQPDLCLPGYPEIFVIGDLANLSNQDGRPLPGVAPVAIQQGAYVARLLKDRLRGETGTPRPFHYRDQGSMATIGRAAAVADLHWIRLSGLPGWGTWLFVHLMSLVAFQNRVLVLLQWAWYYFTRNRSARLITGANPRPGSAAPQVDESAEEAEAYRIPTR